MEEDEPSVIDVDPAGDVILEVCCLDGKRSLLVSSKVLTLASQAFADVQLSIQQRPGQSSDSSEAVNPTVR